MKDGKSKFIAVQERDLDWQTDVDLTNRAVNNIAKDTQASLLWEFHPRHYVRLV